MQLTLDDLFHQAGFTPNDNQRAAIGHLGGPLFLVAGPGSGKTRVLLWRTVSLIVFAGVAPERIFLSTFTEKAAKQLRDGLLSLLGIATQHTGRTYDTSKMYVGTVHSLCRRLLIDRALSPLRARSDAPIVVDELDQYFEVAAAGFWQQARAHLSFEGEVEALRLSINTHFEASPTPSRHKAVVNLLGLFNRLSEENLAPEDLKARVSEAHRPLVALYEFYLRRLGNHRVDLALLQQAAFRAIAASDVGHRLFEHVIVDEYQDTNPIQEEIFLIGIPRVIGSYNPDWGVVRLGPDGKFTLELVRETKGDEDLRELRFTNEARKIRVAQRYFAALGIDYRHLTDETPNYWEPSPAPERPPPRRRAQARAWSACRCTISRSPRAPSPRQGSRRRSAIATFRSARRGSRDSSPPRSVVTRWIASSRPARFACGRTYEPKARPPHHGATA